MWPALLARLLRRRLLVLVGIIGIVYIVASVLSENGAFNALRFDEDLSVHRKRPLIWRTLQEHVMPIETTNRTNDNWSQCRNSVQGQELIADDRGFVCRREQILASGCCNVEVHDIRYYTCESCNNSTHCCGVYEMCVSCCLHPSKRPLLELVLRTITGRQAAVYATVEDHFELCLVKCRTNSHSVEHENKYRNAALKYCYGRTEAHESQYEVAGTDNG